MELDRPDRIVIHLREIIGLIESVLSDYIDPVAAEIVEKKHIALALLDEYCYGCTDIDFNQTFMDYRVPSDVRKQLLERMRLDIYQTIQTTFFYIYPSRTYRYTVHGETVVVEELSRLDITNHESIVEADESDAGHWIPERLRR